MSTTALETRVSKLENLTKKLGVSSQLISEAMMELTGEISTVVREQIKEEMVTSKKEIESNIMTTVSNCIENTVESKVKEKFNERGLSKKDADRLSELRKKRLCHLLHYPSDEYTLYVPYYQGNMRNMYKKHFDVIRYADITPEQYQEAENFINSYDMYDRTWCTKLLYEKYYKDEFDKKSQRHAFERYFNINVA